MAKPAIKTAPKEFDDAGAFTAGALGCALAPFKALANQNAMSPLYKSLRLESGKITGWSSFGILVAITAIVVPETCYVDAHTFIGVINSLDAKQKVIFTISSGSLNWQAGKAKGKIPLSEVKNPPEFLVPDDLLTTPVSKAFVTALDSGSLSCKDPGLATVGMYGVMLDNRDFPAVSTSDNTTASFAPFAESVISEFPETICLPPQGVSILQSIISYSGGLLGFTDEACYYVDDDFQFIVKQSLPLKHDIRVIVEKFSSFNSSVALPPDSIKAFVKRAMALAEAKKGTKVSFSVAGGQIAMAFDDGMSQTDEYWLPTEGADIPDIKPVQLDAVKFARALEVSTTVGLDHAHMGVIVFQNPETLFTYIISGTAEK